MQFREDAKVVTADGDGVGHVDRVVIDPRTEQVTYLIVRKGLLFAEDKILPIDLVASADEKQVRLRQDAGDLEALPDFQEEYYIPLTSEPGDVPYSWGYVPSFYWYPPYGVSPAGHPAYYVPGYVTETEENIPDNTVALKEGADVIGGDGEKVGDVSRILVDESSNQITHFVISKGLLFKEEKLVPINWVSDVAEDKVYLAVEPEVIERVPAYEED